MTSFLLNAQVRTLVIADDDRDDQALLKEAIGELSRDISIHSVYDGVQLLRYLRACAVLPDLILLDMNMPNMNGLECMAEIRADKKLSRLPVVFLSTSSDPADILKGYDCGANLFFSKPNSFAGIRHLMQSLLFVQWPNLPYKLDKSYFVKLATEGAEAFAVELVHH